MANKQKVVNWILLMIVLTLACGLVYVTVHENYRQNANDPQIQLAQDTAAALSSNVALDQIVPKRQVDISQSLDPFLIVYDSQGQVLSSSAGLHGKTPMLPNSVFVTVKQKGERRFTWQPEEGVRSAVVVTPYNGTQTGYVLVGRSLKEVEKREQNLAVMVSVVWLIGLVSTFLVQFAGIPKQLRINIEKEKGQE